MGSEGDRFVYQQPPGTGFDIEAYKAGVQAVMPNLFGAQAKERISDLPDLPVSTMDDIAKSGLQRAIDADTQPAP